MAPLRMAIGHSRNHSQRRDRGLDRFPSPPTRYGAASVSLLRVGAAERPTGTRSSTSPNSPATIAEAFGRTSGALLVFGDRDEPLCMPVPQYVFQRAEYLVYLHAGDARKQASIFLVTRGQPIIGNTG